MQLNEKGWKVFRGKFNGTRNVRSKDAKRGKIIKELREDGNLRECH
jgi:hypothetical protein